MLNWLTKLRYNLIDSITITLCTLLILRNTAGSSMLAFICFLVGTIISSTMSEAAKIMDKKEH
jgi:uncharacterized membrane protein